VRNIRRVLERGGDVETARVGHATADPDPARHAID
jgi:hypothetical protein